MAERFKSLLQVLVRIGSSGRLKRTFNTMVGPVEIDITLQKTETNEIQPHQRKIGKSYTQATTWKMSFSS